MVKSAPLVMKRSGFWVSYGPREIKVAKKPSGFPKLTPPVFISFDLMDLIASKLIMCYLIDYMD